METEDIPDENTKVERPGRALRNKMGAVKPKPKMIKPLNEDYREVSPVSKTARAAQYSRKRLESAKRSASKKR